MGLLQQLENQRAAGKPTGCAWYGNLFVLTDGNIVQVIKKHAKGVPDPITYRELRKLRHALRLSDLAPARAGEGRYFHTIIFTRK